MVKSEIVYLENEVVMKPCQAPKKGRENETKGKDQSPGKANSPKQAVVFRIVFEIVQG
jgi:hypothetical protein